MTEENKSAPRVSTGNEAKRVAFGEHRKSLIAGGDHSLSGAPMEFKPDPELLDGPAKLFAKTTPRDPMFTEREKEKAAEKGKGGMGGPG